MIKEMVLFTHTVTSLWDVKPKFSKSYAEFMLERLTALEIATKKDDPYADLALLTLSKPYINLNPWPKKDYHKKVIAPEKPVGWTYRGDVCVLIVILRHGMVDAAGVWHGRPSVGPKHDCFSNGQCDARGV